MAAKVATTQPPVTDTPPQAFCIMLADKPYRWRLTADALKSIKEQAGASLITLIREGRWDEDTICIVLDAGFRAGWRKGDGELPNTGDVEIGDMLRAVEYIAAQAGTFFGVNVPNMKAAVGVWLNELLAELTAATKPTGTNLRPTAPGSEEDSPESDSGA
jgi:hypothetical protein